MGASCRMLEQVEIYGTAALAADVGSASDDGGAVGSDTTSLDNLSPTALSIA
jgi:hypothetical protein